MYRTFLISSHSFFPLFFLILRTAICFSYYLQEEVRIASASAGDKLALDGGPSGGSGAAAGGATSAGDPNPDEVQPEPLDMAFPRHGFRKQLTYLILFPIIFPLWLTLPDTRSPKGKWARHELALLTPDPPFLPGCDGGGGGRRGAGRSGRKRAARSLVARLLQGENNVYTFPTYYNPALANLARHTKAVRYQLSQKPFFIYLYTYYVLLQYYYKLRKGLPAALFQWNTCRYMLPI